MIGCIRIFRLRSRRYGTRASPWVRVTAPLWFGSLNWGFVHRVDRNGFDMGRVVLATALVHRHTWFLASGFTLTQRQLCRRPCQPARTVPASCCLRLSSTAGGPGPLNHPAHFLRRTPSGRPCGWWLSPPCEVKSRGYFPRGGFFRLSFNLNLYVIKDISHFRAIDRGVF